MKEKPYLPHTVLKAAERGLKKQIEKFEEHLNLGEFDESEDAKPTESTKIIIV